MKWEPTHIIKLIGLIVGFVLVLLGASLLSKEIQAVGSISIQTLFGSGEITSGSAGLFLLFFAFFIMAISLSGMKTSQGIHQHSKSFPKAFKVFISILIALALCIFATMKTTGELKALIGGIAGFLCFILFVSILIIVEAIESDSQMKNK